MDGFNSGGLLEIDSSGNIARMLYKNKIVEIGSRALKLQHKERNSVEVLSRTVRAEFFDDISSKSHSNQQYTQLVWVPPYALTK